MSPQKRVAIAGVTGFLGGGLPRLLAERGCATTGISRAGKSDVPGVDRWQRADTPDLSGIHAVVNLAGEPVNQRWTEERKKLFRESRVAYTRRLVAAIAALPPEERPAVLVNASGVGYYGDRGDDYLTEAAPRGHGYLQDLCGDWEAAAREAEPLGVRVVTVRIGLVLGREGGALKMLRTVFRWGLGGKLGHGRQWMPWIHVEDLRAAIVHAVISPGMSGPCNGTAPQPVTNADFTRAMAAAVRRPAWFMVPAPALGIVFGEFSEAMLQSQRAVPSALVEDGFTFRFNTLEEALADLLG